MKWAVLATLLVLVVVGCVPPILEERHEFVVEVVGEEYLDEVMGWYRPSYSDYILQKKPVIVLYYPPNSSEYSTRKSYYQMSGDFVAAGGDIVDTSNLSADLNRIWSSYTPTYDIDVWWQDDAKEWQAKVKDLSKITLEGRKFFLIEFNKKIHKSGKIYYEVKGLREVEPDDNNIFRLGDVKDGFVVILQEDPSVQEDPSETRASIVSNTKILGAEVVWPVSQ